MSILVNPSPVNIKILNLYYGSTFVNSVLSFNVTVSATQIISLLNNMNYTSLNYNLLFISANASSIYIFFEYLKIFKYFLIFHVFKSNSI